MPASSATPLPHLPWKGGTVQYLVGDGDAREGGVARQVEMWRGYKNQDGTSRQIFTTGQKLSFLNIQYFIFYNSNKKLKLMIKLDTSVARARLRSFQFPLIRGFIVIILREWLVLYSSSFFL